MLQPKKKACNVCEYRRVTVTNANNTKSKGVRACMDCATGVNLAGMGTYSMFRMLEAVARYYNDRAFDDAFRVECIVERTIDNSQYWYHEGLFKADVAIRLLIHIGSVTYTRWVPIEVDGTGHSSAADHLKDALSVLYGFHTLTKDDQRSKVLAIRVELLHPESETRHWAISYMVGLHIRQYFDRCINEQAFGLEEIPRMYCLYLFKRVPVPAILATANLAIGLKTVPASMAPTERGREGAFRWDPHGCLVSFLDTTYVRDPAQHNQHNARRIPNPDRNSAPAPWITGESPFARAIRMNVISDSAMEAFLQTCTAAGAGGVHEARQQFAQVRPAFM